MFSHPCEFQDFKFGDKSYILLNLNFEKICNIKIIIECN